MVTNPPKVSVCIPTRNRSDFLRRAIASALTQTYQDYEILVVDNASTDRTADVLATFSDRRIKYFRNEHDMGMVGNWNRCLQLATGEYVAFLHDDDIWLPNFLERMVEVLNTHHDVSYVHCSCRLMDMEGAVFDIHKVWQEDWLRPGAEALVELIPEQYIYFSTVVARRSCYRTVGSFDESVTDAADIDMWFRLALPHNLAYVAEPLALIRVHSGSSGNFSAILKRPAGEISQHSRRAMARALEQLARTGKDTKSVRRIAMARSVDRQYAGSLQFLFAGYVKRFRKETWEAITIDPSLVLRSPLCILYLASSFLGSALVLRIVGTKRLLERLLSKNSFLTWRDSNQ